MSGRRSFLPFPAELPGIAPGEGAGALALGNYVSIVNAAAIHSQTGPAKTCVAAIGIQAYLSGIFDVDVDMAWSDGTTADSVSVELVSLQPVLTTGAFTGGVVTGWAGGGVAPFGAVPAAVGSGETLQVDAAGGAGILYQGADINDTTGVIQYEDTQATLAGLLTANGNGQQLFSAHGTLSATTATKTPFALSAEGSNKPIIFGIAISATHLITIPTLLFRVSERAAG